MRSTERDKRRRAEQAANAESTRKGRNTPRAPNPNREAVSKPRDGVPGVRADAGRPPVNGAALAHNRGDGTARSMGGTSSGGVIDERRILYPHLFTTPAGTAKPDTKEPVKPSSPSEPQRRRVLTGLRLPDAAPAKPSARSSAPRDARKATEPKPKAKAETKRQPKAEAKKTPPARSSAPRDAREVRKDEPLHCKTRPKPDKPSGRGAGKSRDFVPWC